MPQCLPTPPFTQPLRMGGPLPSFLSVHILSTLCPILPPREKADSCPALLWSVCPPLGRGGGGGEWNGQEACSPCPITHRSLALPCEIWRRRRHDGNGDFPSSSFLLLLLPGNIFSSGRESDAVSPSDLCMPASKLRSAPLKYRVPDFERKGEERRRKEWNAKKSPPSFAQRNPNNLRPSQRFSLFLSSLGVFIILPCPWCLLETGEGVGLSPLFWVELSAS